MTNIDGAATKWQGLRYRCPNCRGSDRGKAYCRTCNGAGSLSESEAVRVYGFIPVGLAELPYCHICLNTNQDEIFPYYFWVSGEYETPEGDLNYKQHRFIYRCKQSHGHEYPGWVFFDVLTGMDIHLGLESP